VTEPWVFGVEPLPPHRALADAVRAAVSLALSLEQPTPGLDALVADLRAAADRLAGEVPPSPLPRVARLVDGDGRPYLDHGRDIPAYNPMFPAYAIDVHGEELATGTISFPVCFEGPPGCVNGGFLSVFFDCVIQHHNCQMGLSGKTRNLNVRYRRPTPLLQELSFRIERTIDDTNVHSDVTLSVGDTVLAVASSDAAIGTRAVVTAVSPRR
jgi:hypothetical protein